ncbi:hypothetical protein BDV96DRAFT_615510 [Lophiotrema nucula]|uniref:Uncharacterized protein n=1 Tax=Lophiotrema nucula TaxID=690887 RepID=A0A6A5YT89_9PLEO|nr:hypothetical protein BDV96DRAFT_615510 [Lophiotrema nucula]
MSHPFQFANRNETRSPLDRQPQNLYPAGQPPSFKTNVNRAKTKKWVEAKANSYDGGDWGEYDEYDEYGTEQEPLPPPPNPATNAGFRQPAQRLGEPSRSFTDPQRQQPPQPGRRNSFEAGDEHRAFSASIAHPSTVAPGSATGQPGFASYPQQPYAPQAPVQAGIRQASAAESDYSDTPQHRRDFSPSALPPPLTTQLSPGPGSADNSPASTSFPPRKSSVGQAESPISPRDRAPSNPTKPLPFIRPADIYRRVEEERQRERASIDSGRPSLDSLTGRPREDFNSPQEQDVQAKPADASKGLQPLETVAERKSEYLPDFNQPSLPPVEGLSTFDTGFFSRKQPSQNAPVVTSPDDQGFRAVVDQAFTRNDESRSVPPTPVSKDSDSSMSRSNTNSTSGISPIMSRVPSSATSALKNRNIVGEESSTPAIAEEPGESSTPVSRPVSTAMLGGAPFQVPRKPSPSHSRNVSSSSLPHASLSTPTSNNSPARSPAIEPQRTLPEAETARLSGLSPTSHDNMEGGTSTSYATREADIASAMRTGPGNAVPELKAAEQESQASFLESHQNTQSPTSSVAPRNRSESPNKNRVQELAGKFGEVSHSRRESTQSSVQSWERSPGNSRPPSPTKADANRSSSPIKAATFERPGTGREASFRPKLPGQWESYATSVPTPPERDGIAEQERTLDTQPTPAHLEDVDLTPTTSRHPVAKSDPSDAQSDPLAALKAAGSAMAEALQASVGLGHVEEDSSRSNPVQSYERSYGDIHQTRPVYLDRTASSVASSIPPTPPEKDTPESEELPPPPPLKEKSPEPRAPFDQDQTPTRPTIVPQLSTDPSVHDQESDRLRKEIVASLTPQRSAESPEAGRTSLHPIASHTTNRESSLLPSEYDSYWADGDHTSPRPSTELGGNVSEHSPVAAKSTEPQISDVKKSALLTRFSWEDNAAGHGAPGQQAHDGAAPAIDLPKEEEKPTSPAGHRSLDSLPSQSFEGIPDPYFGPGHVEAGTEPEFVKGADLTARAPTPPPDSAKPAIELEKVDTIREASPPPPTGLHVVNSELNPEAVDMPPRLSKEVSPASPISPQAPQSPISAMVEDKNPFPRSSQDNEVAAPEPLPYISGPSSTHEPVAKSPISDKPLGFREIVTLPSSSERIATYNRTRDYWANADHGLNDWISSAVAANPELSSATISPPRPALGHSATSRHKTTPSLSLFGKHKDSSPAQSTPYYEQYNSAASQVPTTPTSSSAAALPGSNTKVGGRSTSHQMQTKGKDLLHTANVLGGKGMTGAKGLFAKGKSRFKGGDKVDK